MGEDISRSSFEDADFERFAARLRQETGLLSDKAREGGFSEDGYVIGFEIEAWLLDHGFFPNPVNEEFLAAMADPLVVPELSRFNVELNCAPLPLSGDVLSRSHAALSELLARCNRVAHGLDSNIVTIGTIPVLRDRDLSLDNLTPHERYRALNHEIFRLRKGRPIRVEIAGDDYLCDEHCDVMLEAATTSFQVHLKTPARLAHRFYNASVMASGPVLAAAANSPFLFGRALWHETRIPLFEQSVGLSDHDGEQGRVTFGRGYVKSSPVEILAENAARYPVLLPLAFDDPPEAFRHVRLHNGTIWRWNRPLVGFEDDGTPHLRIEHRTMPSGPTVIDMMANAALYVGLVRAMVDEGFDEAGGLAFADAEANLRAAARSGLGAAFRWPGADRAPADALLLDELVPMAERGLAAFGIAAADRDLYLGVVATRVRTGRNGAAWQRAAREAHKGDFRELMAAYCEGQRSGAPVHEWDL